MRTTARTLALLSLLSVLVAAAPRPVEARPAPSPLAASVAPPLAPPAVLARYAAALEDVRPPALVSFEYAIEQVGSSELEQFHRVYRRGADERDETLALYGRTLKEPAVRVALGRINRYDIALTAPRPERYAFTFAAKVPAGTHYDYVFRTTPRAASAFTVTSVTLDGVRFLPVRIAFALGGATLRAAGTLDYAPSGKYWLIRAAAVDATVDGKVARERIAWTHYAFPDALPPQAFSQRP